MSTERRVGGPNPGPGIGVTFLVALLVWAVIIGGFCAVRAAGDEGGDGCQEPTTTTVADLPCGFTDGTPVGCYAPEVPCDDTVTTTAPAVVTVEPAVPVVYVPAVTG